MGGSRAANSFGCLNYPHSEKQQQHPPRKSTSHYLIKPAYSEKEPAFAGYHLTPSGMLDDQAVLIQHGLQDVVRRRSRSGSSHQIHVLQGDLLGDIAIPAGETDRLTSLRPLPVLVTDAGDDPAGHPRCCRSPLEQVRQIDPVPSCSGWKSVMVSTRGRAVVPSSPLPTRKEIAAGAAGQGYRCPDRHGAHPQPLRPDDHRRKSQQESPDPSPADRGRSGCGWSWSPWPMVRVPPPRLDSASQGEGMIPAGSR